MEIAGPVEFMVELMAAWPFASILIQSAASIAAGEAFRLGIVYIHLIACCVAIGLVFTSDVTFVSRLLKGDSRYDSEHLAVLQKTVSVALATLWITGLVIVVRDASLSGWSYYLNPKIQAKVLIVCLLTLNGFLLHSAVLPSLKKAGELLKLSPARSVLAAFAGAVSAVSWFYAAMLGVGRPLNWKYSLSELLAMYPVFIAAGFVAMLLFTAWAKHRITAARLRSRYMERREPTLSARAIEQRLRT